MYLEFVSRKGIYHNLVSFRDIVKSSEVNLVFFSIIFFCFEILDPATHLGPLSVIVTNSCCGLFIPKSFKTVRLLIPQLLYGSSSLSRGS